PRQSFDSTSTLGACRLCRNRTISFYVRLHLHHSVTTVKHLSLAFGLTTNGSTTENICRFSYTIVPNRVPTAAVNPMASAPQKVTRMADFIIGAPPARAANTPKQTRKMRELIATTEINLVSGVTSTVRSGIPAPTAKVTADASAACTGRAVKLSEMPSSSLACAANASWAI